MKRRLLALACLLIGASGSAAAQPAQWSGTIEATITAAGKPTRVGFYAELWQLEEGGLLTLLQRGQRACTGVFAPAATAAQMGFLGATCREIPTMALASGPQGSLKGSLVLNGTPVEFTLQPDPVMSSARPAVPAAPIDIRGVTLKATVADTFAEIKKVTGATQEPRFTGHANNPYWEVEGTDQSTYVVFGASEALSAAPVALVRKWTPEQGQQPTLGALKQSLVQKYGPPSADIGAFRRQNDRPSGLLWSYDLAGHKLEGAAARFCSFREFSSDTSVKDRPERHLPSVYKFWLNRNSREVPDLPIGHVPGCGYQVTATWLNGLDDNQLVEVFAQSLIDPQAALAYVMQVQIASVRKRLGPLLQRFQAAKAGAKVDAPL